MRRRRRAKDTLADRLGRVLDGVCRVFDPQYALERQQAREAMRIFGSYRAAENARWRRGSVTTTGHSGDWHLKAAELAKLRDACRENERTNGIFDGVINRWVDEVFGPHMAVQARTTDPEWNKRAEDWWRGWCERADATRMEDYFGLVRLAGRSVLRDGDIGFIMLSNGQLQPFEGDRLATPHKTKRTIVNGVELGKYGQPKAYWVAPYAANGAYVKESELKRVGAQDVIFLAHRKRVSQTRGVPVMAAALQDFEQADDYIEATLMKERVEACLTAVLTQDTDGPAWKSGAPLFGAQSTEEGDSGNNQQWQELEPGRVVGPLPPGMEVSLLDPRRPSSTFGPFISNILQFCVMELGMFWAMFDLREVNYSSLRGGLLSARRTFRWWQNWFAARLVGRTYRWKISQAVKHGELDKPSGEDENNYWKHQVILPGWDWVDPQKEAEAETKAIDYSIKTLADVAASQGRDWGDTMRQKAEIIRTANDLGTEMDIDPKELLYGPAAAQEARNAATQPE